MRKRGFTLIEMVIVIGLLAVVSFGVSSYLFEITGAWMVVRSRESALSSARSAMNRMTREIRRINKPSEISTYDAADLVFKDINNVQIEFKQAGTDLYRLSDILASNLVDPGGLNFTYLTQNGAVTDVGLDIRIIRVELHLKVGKEDLYLRSSARIRNLD